MEQLNPRQKALAQEIIKISSAGIGGPYNALLRSPEMAEQAMGLFGYFALQNLGSATAE